MRAWRTRRRRGEEGAALELALLFVAGSAIIVTSLLTFASTSANSTVVTRATRSADYDADAAMQATIATIRVSATQGVVGSCGSVQPALAFNDSTRPLRVDCTPIAAPTLQRHVVLSVCSTSIPAPCPDGKALLRADVTFYDYPTVGKSLSLQYWSNS